MKKKRKTNAAARGSGPPAPGSKTGQEPPADLINELATLLNAGELVLLEQKANEVIRRWPGHFIGWKALGILMLMQGRHADALEPLTNTVKLASNDAQAHQNLGSAYLALERYAEAEACFRHALDLNPDYVQAHNNLGITLLKLGRFEEAEVCYRHALALKPDFAEAHNNLGNVIKERGRLKEAAANYRHALAFNPDFAEAHNNLGNVLLELGNIDKAKASYQQALALNPDYVRAHSGLGDILLRRGRTLDAVVHYRKCIDQDRLWLKAHDGLNKALGHLVPLWHVAMMNDKLRNDAFFAALQRAITPATHVLEIGTGSGLLAMMAARLGAREVTTCEAVPVIAETARTIVADNGFTPPITVVAKKSTKMKIGKDMRGRADLLVSEILSSEFLGEGVLSSIEDAKTRLLKPGAIIIPARGSIQFALFGGNAIKQNVLVEEVYGFDLSKFNTIVSRKQYISRNDLDIELLTDGTCAFFFDFVQTDRFPFEERNVVEVPVRRTGRCCGIIQWIRLEMDDTVVFENHPSIKNPAAGWQHCAYVFPAPIDVRAGQVAVITAAHNRNTPWFFFEGLK